MMLESPDILQRTDSPLGKLLRGALSGEPCDTSILQSEVAEGEFQSLSLEHGLLPLIFDRQQATGNLKSWPLSIRTSLEHEAIRQKVITVLTQREIGRVLAALAAAGVGVLLMKGASLSHSHYPLPHLRPHDDVDLLVERRDLERIDGVMQKLGYKRPNTVTGEIVMHQLAYIRTDAQGVEHTFDLHWKISNRPVFAGCFSHAELSNRSIALPALGDAARGLAPVDALLLVCIHRVGHHRHNERLIWLYDIHLLATGFSFAEEEQFLERAKTKQIRAICLDGLIQAKSWYGTDSRLIECLADHESAWAEPSHSYLTRGSNSLRDMLLDFRELSFSGKCRLVREHVFPPASYIRQKYKTSSRLLLPGQYLARAIRGLFRQVVSTTRIGLSRQHNRVK